MLRLSAIALLASVPSILGQISYKDYDNDFVDPGYILAKNFNSSTAAAQQTIVQWADFLAAQGPWSVMNKSVTAPTGNKHDYLSWAPYSWPNCTGVGNTTELSPPQVWVECPYVYRDGQFNPDRLLVNNTGDFQAMSDAVFYNSLAWVLTGQEKYSANAAHYVDTWFINPNTAVTPNLIYAQLERGPTGQIGAHTGLLDYHQMPKIVSGILLLREGHSPDWTTELDTQMNNWTTNYIDWMTTDTISLQEEASTNNHGTYFVNQLAALQILVNDKAGAINSTQNYFSKLYMTQVTGTGEQPREAERTHPYHYRCYNLAAMVTNARIGAYLGLNFWNTTTTTGGTIQKAADFTMTVPLNTTDGDGPIWELYPSLGAIASVTGDLDHKYANFLAAGDSSYPAEPFFLWNQPLWDSNLASADPTTTSTTSGSTSGSTSGAMGALSGHSALGYVSLLGLSVFLYFG